MTDRFLEEYFPPEKTARCREAILSFKQHGAESLYEGWIRFKDLLRQCPHHGIPILQLMDKFYNGLDGRSRYTLDMASSGAFDSMTPDAAWDFLEKMSKKSQHWETQRGAVVKDTHSRDPLARPGIHQVDDITAISAQMEALSRQVAQLQMQPAYQATSQPEPQIVCELCGGGHYTIECQPEQLDYIGPNQSAPNQFGNTYNPNWRNHPNFSWRSGPTQNNAYPQRPNPNQGLPFQPRQFQAIRPPAPPHQPQYTDKFERRMQDNEANIRNIQATLQNLDVQMGQISKLLTERQPGTFPAHTETNPKEQL